MFGRLQFQSRLHSVCKITSRFEVGLESVWYFLNRLQTDSNRFFLDFFPINGVLLIQFLALISKKVVSVHLDAYLSSYDHFCKKRPKIDIDICLLMEFFLIQFMMLISNKKWSQYIWMHIFGVMIIYFSKNRSNQFKFKNLKKTTKSV